MKTLKILFFGAVAVVVAMLALFSLADWNGGRSSYFIPGVYIGQPERPLNGLKGIGRTRWWQTTYTFDKMYWHLSVTSSNDTVTAASLNSINTDGNCWVSRADASSYYAEALAWLSRRFGAPESFDSFLSHYSDIRYWQCSPQMGVVLWVYELRGSMYSPSLYRVSIEAARSAEEIISRGLQ